MGDQLAPEWVKRIKQADHNEAARRELENQRRVAAEKTLKADGPAFWTSVVQELKRTSDSLSEIGIRSTFSEIGGQGERGCRIELAAGFPRVSLADVNVFYRGDHLSCHAFGGLEVYSIEIAVNHGGQIVGTHGSSVLGAEQIAQRIVEPLVGAVRS